MAQNRNEITSPPHATEGFMAAEVGAALAGKLVEYVAPSIISRAQMLFTGKTLLILGPPRAGKTNFLNYLAAGILQPEKETSPTPQIHPGKNATFKLGKHRNTVVRIWKPLDIPGSVDAEAQVEYVEEYKPNCLVVVLDASKFSDVSDEESHLRWLSSFCLRLNSRLIQRPKVARKLKTMFVLMNKWDKMPKMDEKRYEYYLKHYENEVRNVLDERLNNDFYRKGGSNLIEVMPCVLIEKSKWERHSDRVLEAIGLRLND